MDAISLAIVGGLLLVLAAVMLKRGVIFSITSKGVSLKIEPPKGGSSTVQNKVC